MKDKNLIEDYINEIEVEKYSCDEISKIISKGKKIKKQRKNITISLCLALILALSIVSITVLNINNDSNEKVEIQEKAETIVTTYVPYKENSLEDVIMQREIIIIKEKLGEYIENNEPLSKYIVEKENGDKIEVYFYFGIYDTKDLLNVESIKGLIDTLSDKTELISKRYDIEHIPNLGEKLEVLIKENGYVIEIL